MEAQEIYIFPGKSDQQLLEFVNPREIALNREAVFVHLLIESAFTSALDPFSIALVLGNIRTDTTVP